MTDTKTIFTEYKNIGNTHVIRLLLPNGMYPKCSIKLDDCALYISEDVCFSITPNSNDKISDEYYSEVEWAKIPELRLYAATMLCVDRQDGYCCLYPFRYCHYLDDPELEINEFTLNKIRCSLIEEIELPGRWIEEHQFMAQNIYKSFRNLTLPKVCGGESYSLHDAGLRIELLNQIYTNFDVKDYLLIRGVSTLMRSAMLGQSGFTEEAAILAFISLDASFNIVLKRLKNNGIKNPSSEDAMKFIANTFCSDVDGKYFEYYYEQRIKTVHPESRFGVFPHAPLFVDDYNDLFDDLLELYAFFISGYINPKLQERHEQQAS